MAILRYCVSVFLHLNELRGIAYFVNRAFTHLQI